MLFAEITFPTSELTKSIQLIFSLAALVLIVKLFLSAYQNKIARHVENSNSKWLHTLYIGGIAAFILLEFIVYVVLNSDQKDNIIDTISFGSTLSSLILSVVAIIFTIVSGKNGQEQLGQITQATRELNNIVTALPDVNDLAILLSDRIQDMESMLQEIKSETQQMHIDTKEIKNNLMSMTNDKNDVELNLKSVDNKLVSYISEGSILGNLALFSCALSKRKNKTFKLFPEDDYINSYDYGYLMSSGSMGIIGINGAWPNINVSSTDEDLELTCKSYFIYTIYNASDEEKHNILGVLNEMLIYYGEQEWSMEYVAKEFNGNGNDKPKHV